MIDLLLMVGGLVGWFITKNKRWLILTIIGIVWFILDVIFITLGMIA